MRESAAEQSVGIIDQKRLSSGSSEDGVLRTCKKRDGLFAAHAREPYEEIVERTPRRLVIEKVLDWNAGASKDGRSA